MVHEVVVLRVAHSSRSSKLLYGARRPGRAWTRLIVIGNMTLHLRTFSTSSLIVQLQTLVNDQPLLDLLEIFQ